MCYEIVKEEILKKFKKEYFCHLIYVEKIALNLQKKLGGDLEIIKIASIGHDIGRIEGGDNDLHAEKGAVIIHDLLIKNGYSTEKAKSISRCTLMHNKIHGFESIEEEIISNADALSKLLYHNMFMLMCKKDDYIGKAKWGLKYTEKGYKNLSFDFLKNDYKDLYLGLKEQYTLIINS